MLDLLLPSGSTISDLSKIQLEIQVYVTRENQPPESDSQKLFQTKYFKPNPSDLPISPVLGPNSWLYLCLITASSFILFLVLLTLVTQYHIYPIDQGTNRTYNFTIWVLWDLFLMCISIILISSVIFLLQKRKITIEAKQIKNVEIPMPVTSPGSWLYSRDRELESLPYQSLVQATQVHYGGRPDLKSIFFSFFHLFHCLLLPLDFISCYNFYSNYYLSTDLIDLYFSMYNVKHSQAGSYLIRLNAYYHMKLKIIKIKIMHWIAWKTKM